MYTYKITIIRIIDGDTVAVRVDLGCDVRIDLTIRLYGINAPEMSRAAGEHSWRSDVSDTVSRDAIERLTAWAECVRRLIAVAPIAAVSDETGVVGGHSTPPERAAIRREAIAVVDRWLERDRAALEGAPDDPE